MHRLMADTQTEIQEIFDGKRAFNLESGLTQMHVFIGGHESNALIHALMHVMMYALMHVLMHDST